jgi:hypothetical protein
MTMSNSNNATRTAIDKRWIDEATSGDDATRRARELIRLSISDGALSPARLEGVRLRFARRAPTRAWFALPERLLRPAAAAVGFAVAGLAFAHIGGGLRRRPTTPPIAAPPVSALTSPAVGAPPTEPIGAPQELTPRRRVEVALPPVTMPVAPARRHEVARRPLSSEDASLGEQARLVGEALRLLRERHDVDGALALLGQFERRFPSGQLAPEAHAALGEALLMRPTASHDRAPAP